MRRVDVYLDKGEYQTGPKRVTCGRRCSSYVLAQEKALHEKILSKESSETVVPTFKSSVSHSLYSKKKQRNEISPKMLTNNLANIAGSTYSKFE
ncbi:MAG: hypothetical protein ACYC9U_05075 [Nitrososphaerales archaeon]